MSIAGLATGSCGSARVPGDARPVSTKRASVKYLMAGLLCGKTCPKPLANAALIVNDSHTEQRNGPVTSFGEGAAMRRCGTRIVVRTLVLLLAGCGPHQPPRPA